MSNLLEIELRLAERYIKLIKDSGRLENIPKLNAAEELLRNRFGNSNQAKRSKLLLAELLSWRDSLSEALSLCEEIIEYFGFNQDALFQKAIILIQMGDLIEAEKILEILQKANPCSSIFQRYQAMCKFQTDRISEGWEDAKLAFNFSNLRIRYDNLVPWSGEDFRKAVVVVSMLDVRGGGDEIMFSSALALLIEEVELCFIETDLRSFELYTSSFEDCIIFVKGNEPWKEMGIDVDFHIWSRELAPYFFSSSEKFQNKPGYLRISSNQQKHWNTKINSLGEGKKKIGICWTSLNRIGPNQPCTSVLSDWGPIFKIPDSMFINLHSLDGEDEVESAKKEFSIDFINVEGADFLNCFDHVAGVAKACDVVLALPTTVSNIDGAVGARVIELRPSYTPYCMDVLPWYPNHQRYYRTWDQSYREAIERAAKEVRAL